MHATTGIAVLQAGAHIRIVGWCADPQSRKPGPALIATVDRARRIDLTSGVSRRAAGRFELLRITGAARRRILRRTLPRTIGPGAHDIAIGVVATDGGSIAVFPTVVHVRVLRTTARTRTARKRRPRG
jgi:hypothetical protein